MNDLFARVGKTTQVFPAANNHPCKRERIFRHSGRAFVILFSNHDLHPAATE